MPCSRMLVDFSFLNPVFIIIGKKNNTPKDKRIKTLIATGTSGPINLISDMVSEKITTHVKIHPIPLLIWLSNDKIVNTLLSIDLKNGKGFQAVQP